MKHNPNYFRILAYTNKAVSAYNNQVRELLGYTSPTPNVGEPMTGYTNWGYNWKTKSYRFINSESYKVSKIDKPHKITTSLNDGTAVTMEAIPLTLEDPVGNVDTFDFIDIKSNPSNLQAAIQLANEKKMLWAKAKHAVGRDAKAKIYQRINFIDNFLFVNDNIEDSNHNLLQAKTIDFGYAMTVHKSQGSTFTNVLMDDVDISRAGLNSNNAMEVIDLGEVDNNVASNANFTGDAEDVDLGFSNDFSTTPTEPTEHTEPTQTINLKQQLEYVGVSRATDTVTIVSNNVKKEGSPLNPTTPTAPTSPTTPTVPTKSTKGTSSSITSQLISHLKSKGINILGKAAMAEYLKTHDLKYLQQYINKNELPKGELNLLSSTLMTKYGNKTAYGDVIYTANYEYTVNYKGAGEFDIIEYHQIDNNINERINDRERKGISRPLDRLSSRDEIAQRQYKSNSYNVEDREPNGHYARLDKSTSQRESKQSQSNDGVK